MTAPSTAEGRYWMGAVRSSRIRPTAAMLTRPLTWLVTFIESFTAVRDPLVPIGKPCEKPAATFARLNACASWSASTRSR